MGVLHQTDILMSAIDLIQPLETKPEIPSGYEDYGSSLISTVYQVAAMRNECGTLMAATTVPYVDVLGLISVFIYG